ncbi:MFS transporter [Microbacterium elymi]|uniref:MFS transporter n=1 Tax=Microbacterium elymi TaxID=2909587 RepID=UPI00338F234B
MLALFAWIAYSTLPDAAMLVCAFLIGATAPQVAPLSRSRLVTIIGARIAPDRRDRVFNATMAYESAADETVFVIGPFIVGVLASLIAPWAPLVGAAVLTVVFVGAFALHPTSPPPQTRSHGAAVGPVSELFRPTLLVVVVGILGVGLFFGSMLTSLTAFMDDRGAPEQAGLLYGVMGIGSATLALAVAVFPESFRRSARWLVFGAVILAGTLALPFVTGVGTMIAALAVIGIGIGPTLVTQYSFGAERKPGGPLGHRDDDPRLGRDRRPGHRLGGDRRGRRARRHRGIPAVADRLGGRGGGHRAGERVPVPHARDCRLSRAGR